MKRAVDNNLYTCGVFLDFAKAFDTVNHQILLNKLEAYGIRGIPLKWFTSYLFNRQQYVSVNSVESSKQTMKCGIPQGSSLGPLLFLLGYINDIINCSDQLNFRIFADDTNVFASSPSIRDLEKLMNEELAKIKEWCDLNKLSINIKKTNYMIVKSQKKKPGNTNIKLPNNDGNSDIIEKTDHIKYLGVFLDEKLPWKHHIAYVCSRIARNTGIFTKLRQYMSLAQLKQLYYSLVHPYISYAILAWGSGSKTQIKKVQTKQNIVIRTIFFATSHGKNTESALPLLNLLDILSVTSIFKMQALKFAHRWHHIAYVCSRIARNTGIFTKLRQYMSLAQLKQLYYSLVHPYISYAILAWGSGSKTQIKKVQTKQNIVIRTIFFATSHGKNTESALPLLNLLDILSVTSIFKMQALKFAHRWHIIKHYQTSLTTISSMLMIFTVITQDMLLIRTFISHAQEPTLGNSPYLQL